MILKGLKKLDFFGKIKVRYISDTDYNHYFFFDFDCKCWDQERSSFNHFIDDYSECYILEMYAEDNFLVITIENPLNYD